MKRALPLLALAAVVLVGCKPARTVVGNWTVEGLPVPGDSNCEFKSDGTADLSVNANMQGVNAKFSLTGTYAVSGDQISLTGQNLSVSGVPDQFKSYQAQIEATVKDKLNQVGTGKLQWHNNDEFVIAAQDGGTYTFKRKK